jgi:RNA polymerase-interacting CarD/CdnL/TRCF family regulator
MFDTAKNLLVTELSLVQRVDESAVAQRIERIFS